MFVSVGMLEGGVFIYTCMLCLEGSHYSEAR